MSTPLTINGVTYQYPALGDENWATDASGWASAVSTGLLQRSGGTFTLTADVDFGALFGLKAQYVKSRGTNIAGTGIVRMANAESVVWRNAANSADLPLTVNASNQLQFNGNTLLASAGITDVDISASAAISFSKLAALSSANILVGNVSNVATSVAMTGDIAITNGGVTSIGAGKIVNSQVNAAAAIAGTKIAPDFGSQNIVTTGSITNGAFTSSTANPASAGIVRLANNEGLNWRNAANSGNLPLAVNASNALQFNSITLADLTSTQTLSGKTLTTPIINQPTINGTTDGSTAGAGVIGQEVRSAVSVATNVGTSAQYFDATSISLTAGTWLLFGQISYSLNGATFSGTESLIGISTTTGNSGTGQVVGDSQMDLPDVPTSQSGSGAWIAGLVVRPASTTTYYLKGFVTYSAGTPQYRCRFNAIRIF